MDVQQIAPGLWHWTAPHPDWTPKDAEDGRGWEQLVSSYAVVEGDTLLLFDPLVPADEEERFWRALDRDVEGHGPPSILLTVFWHARSAQAIVDRYEGASVWVHDPATEWTEKRVQHTNTFTPGAPLPAGVEAIPMQRVEEIAYWLPQQRAAAFGDTVLGHGDRADLCPEGWLRPEDSMDEVRAAVRGVLDRRPRRLLLTHGGPYEPGALEV
jgi:glyoxylase-like metal-dependent hydrolase (beta-lactamase superfamily II)